MPQTVRLHCGVRGHKELMVSVLQLTIIDPAIQEVEDGVGHQAQDVLHQRPHIGVPRFPISMHG
uniref:Uncharacterized protein n=1 Tax=Anguilla anguilla TaxID=7936 RepID=A0A0E9QHS3_ANGAN